MSELTREKSEQSAARKAGIVQPTSEQAQGMSLAELRERFPKEILIRYRNLDQDPTTILVGTSSGHQHTRSVELRDS